VRVSACQVHAEHTNICADIIIYTDTCNYCTYTYTYTL
jgi:hypothetical protein